MEDRRKEREARRRKRQQQARLQWAVLILAVMAIVGCIVILSGTGQELPPGTAQSGKFTFALQGSLAITLEYGTDYAEPGFITTWDGEPVEASVVIDEPQMTKLGEYIITYTATYKNKTLELQRAVKIVDTQPPVLTLIELPGHFTEEGAPYVDEGCTAIDNYDGDISDKITAVQNGAVMTYTVTDSSGNTATITRTIVFGDAIAPEITLLGGETVTVPVGTVFEDPGYTAVDNVDGDLTASVTVSGEYDRYLPGSYTLIYRVTDKHGNTAAVVRTLVVEALKQPDIIDPGNKVIYLTFDDGPSEYTPRLLEILEKYNVKVTFFVVGDARLEYLDDIAAAGHAIGIHTDSHVYSKIYSSEDAYFKDFYAIRDKIYDHTGIYTTLMRFPGGSSNGISKKYCPGIMTKLTNAVERLGFQYFDWNVDSNDANGKGTAQSVYENVISGIRDNRPNIVLQHDIFDYSVEAVEKIVQWGLANGYTFLPLDTTSPNAHHTVKN